MSTAYLQYSRKTAAILVVLAMVLALFPMAAFASHGQFTDVSGTLADEILAAHNAGLVDGYEDGSFRPNENVTRAAFAKMVVLALEEASGQELPGGTEPFSDVNASQALYSYVVKAYNAKLINGYADGTFGYNKPILRQEAAAILQRALKLADAAESFADVPDNSAFAKAIGAVAAAGVMGGYNSTTFAPGDNITRGQAAAVAYRAYDHLIQQAKYEVVAVTAVSPSALRVTFNKAVSDTSKVTFTVKRDGLDVTLTPAWAEDKTSVELKSTTRLTPGTYTVTVAGLDFAAGKNSGTVQVEAEKVAKIELVGDKLIKLAKDGADAAKARISYRVFNQYGEDITSGALGDNVQWAVSAGSATANDGVLTVTTSDNSPWKVDQKVVVTGVDPATGTSVSKTLTVTEAGVLSSFSFGKVVYPENISRLYIGEENAGWIEVAATDENGNAVDETALRSAVSLVVSNPGLTADFTTEDGKLYVALNSKNLGVPGKVTITAVVVAKPELNKTITLDFVAHPYPADIDLGSFSGILAAGDKAGSLVVDLTAYDQFGDPMSAKDIAAAFSAGLIQVSDAGAVDLALGVATEGDNLGKLINTQDVPNATGFVTITVVAVNSGDTDSIQVQVRPARQPAELVVPADLSNLLTGASSTIALGFKDQYGSALKVSEGAYEAYGYEVAVNGLDVVEVTVGKTTVTAPVGSKIGSLKVEQNAVLADLTNIGVKGLAEGTATITVKLLKDKKDISQVSFTVEVAKAVSSLKYTIATIPTLYWDADGDGLDFTYNDQNETWEERTDIVGGVGGSADSVYAEEVKVLVEGANGKKYVLNPERIIGFDTDRWEFGIGKDNAGRLKVWSDLTEMPWDEKDIQGTVTVLFNTEDGKVLTLQAPVKISGKDRQIEAVYVQNEPVAGYADDELPGDPVSSVEYDVQSTGSVVVGYIVAKDNFGRYWTPTWTKIGFANIKGVNVGLASGPVNSNAIVIDAGAVSLKEGVDEGSFDIVVYTANGKTTSVTIHVVQ